MKVSADGGSNGDTTVNVLSATELYTYKSINRIFTVQYNSTDGNAQVDLYVKLKLHVLWMQNPAT